MQIEQHGSRALLTAWESGPSGSAPSTADLRRILGLSIWDVDLQRAARFIVDNALAGSARHIFFVNAHCVNVAAGNPAYAELLTGAPFVFADGAGMALAARLSGTALANNVNGTDLFPEICAAAARTSIPVAFLGARPGIARACAERMQRQFPGLRVVWTGHGFLASADEATAISELNESGARIVFVAKGVPTQELWIDANARRLTAPVLLGVGALFDFYSGEIRRAPRFLRVLRLEWLWRLLQEPRRLFVRYVVGNPAFVVRVLMWRASGR